MRDGPCGFRIRDQKQIFHLFTGVPATGGVFTEIPAAEGETWNWVVTPDRMARLTHVATGRSAFARCTRDGWIVSDSAEGEGQVAHRSSLTEAENLMRDMICDKVC